MDDEEESSNIINNFLNSKFFSAIEFIILLPATYIGLSTIKNHIDPNFANLILATIATSTSIVAVSIVAIDRRTSAAEKCLYNFYYPLQDYLDGYLIQGMNQDKKDIEQIAHYRQLAKIDTRREFEKYRNGNYKREDSTELARLVRRDIKKYERKLRK